MLIVLRSQHRKQSFLHFGICLLSAFCHSVALCLSTSNAIAEPLTAVTGSEAYAPYTDPADAKGGIFSAIVLRSFQRQGHDISLTYLPWLRGYESTRTNDTDMTFPYIKDEQRLRDFYYSDPVFAINFYLMFNRNNPLHGNSEANLKGKTLCRPLGYTTRPIQKLIDAKIIWIWKANTMEECYQLLDMGQLDAIVVERKVGRTTSEKLFGDPDYFGMLPQAFRSTGLHVIVSRQNPRAREIISQFNRGYEALLSSPEGRELFEAYDMPEPNLQVLEFLRKDDLGDE